MLGPQNTSSSRVTSSYTDTLFWIRTLLPIRTRLPTNTFCPSEHRSPMTAPAHTWVQCQTRVPSPIVAPASTSADSCTDAPRTEFISVVERQRNAPPVARGQVCRDQKLQRLEALPPVGLRLRIAAQHVENVVVVEWMPVAVDGSRLIAGRADLGIRRIRFGELPMQDFVDGDAADARGTALADNRDRAFEVLRVG